MKDRKGKERKGWNKGKEVNKGRKGTKERNEGRKERKEGRNERKEGTKRAGHPNGYQGMFRGFSFLKSSLAGSE